MATSASIIGIDFDNTIACYDRLFIEVGVEIGGLRQSIGQSKREVRDHVRKLPRGEEQWQRMQAEVYGPRMRHAELYPGVTDFLETCYNRAIAVYIISHKTQHATLGTGDVNLRTEALKWMNAKKIIAPTGPGLRPGNIYFESTREQKIARISELGCTHFIDDLVEVLDHANFPTTTERIHFAPGEQSLTGHSFPTVASWHEIRGALFNV
ncbi:MAG: hypothetical protein P8J29_08450 [Rhodospirillales bacterium]|nr:hypothetical protein [Rhodospirillales bacterium]